MIIEKIKSSSLAELIGALTTILFVIGASYRYGFYSGDVINEKWLVQLYSPTDLLFANLDIVILYVTSMIYLDHLFTREKSTLGTLIYGNIVLIIFTIFLYFNAEGYEFTLAILIGFNAMVAVLKAKYVGKLSGGLALLFLIPYGLGMSDIKKALTKGSLPKVHIENEIKDWRLLEAFSDKAVLINKEVGRNNIKIVELKDIKFIESATK